MLPPQDHKIIWSHVYMCILEDMWPFFTFQMNKRNINFMFRLCSMAFTFLFSSVEKSGAVIDFCSVTECQHFPFTLTHIEAMDGPSCAYLLRVCSFPRYVLLQVSRWAVIPAALSFQRLLVVHEHLKSRIRKVPVVAIRSLLSWCWFVATSRFSFFWIFLSSWIFCALCPVLVLVFASGRLWFNVTLSLMCDTKASILWNMSNGSRQRLACISLGRLGMILIAAGRRFVSRLSVRTMS